MRGFGLAPVGGILILIGTAIATVSSPARAQVVEDPYYEVFNPAAPAMGFRDRVVPEIEYYSTKTMRIEKRTIDPALLEPANGLEFYLFRIGQADAMLVVGPGPDRRSLLFDLGVSREQGFAGRFSAQHVGQRIIDILGKRHVDYFVLSHFHSDHFGSGDSGVTALIAHGGFTVGKMIDTGQIGAEFVARSAGANEYIARQANWVRAGKVGAVERPQFGTGQIALGLDVTIDIAAFGGRFSDQDEGVHARYQRVHPGHYRQKPTSENDLSIALKIALGNFEFWTAGDFSGASGAGTAALSGSNKNYTNVEWPLVQRWRQLGTERDVEVFRANHHGSGYSNTRQLLTALDPEVILYSAQTGHGHPTRDAVTRGKETAIAYATGVDPGTWTPDAFANEGGSVVGEIRLFVAPGGISYTVNGRSFRSFSDAEERANADSAR